VLPGYLAATFKVFHVNDYLTVTSKLLRQDLSDGCHFESETALY